MPIGWPRFLGKHFQGTPGVRRLFQGPAPLATNRANPYPETSYLCACIFYDDKIELTDDPAIVFPKVLIATAANLWISIWLLPTAAHGNLRQARIRSAAMDLDTIINPPMRPAPILRGTIKADQAGRITVVPNHSQHYTCALRRLQFFTRRPRLFKSLG